MSETWSKRIPGTGVPAVPWKVSEYGDYGEYDGHSFVTADPKGMGRSVCNGFVDDMAWVAHLHNSVVADGWRARIARHLLRIPHPVWPVGSSEENTP